MRREEGSAIVLDASALEMTKQKPAEAGCLIASEQAYFFSASGVAGAAAASAAVGAVAGLAAVGAAAGASVWVSPWPPASPCRLALSPMLKTAAKAAAAKITNATSIFHISLSPVEYLIQSYKQILYFFAG
jgi:hypothetical protein